MKLVLTLMLVLFSQAGHTTTPALQKFVDQYKKSATLQELVANLRSFDKIDREFLRAAYPGQTELPKVTLSGDTVRFGTKTTLKIVDLASQKFELNGKPVRYDSTKSFASNVYSWSKLETKKVGWGDLLLPPAFATGPNPLLFGVMENTTSTGGLVVVGALGLFGLGAGLSTVAVHNVLMAGYEVAAPSCKTQVQELKTILSNSQPKIALSGIDCNGEIKKLWKDEDKSVSFWTESGEKKFKTDWNKSMAWDSEKRVFIFDQESLKDYRELDGEPTIKNYQATSPNIAAARKEIEPYRKVFHYFGKNSSCSKCHSEIQNEVVAKSAPSFVRTNSGHERSGSPGEH